MRRRPPTRFPLVLERFEEKRLPGGSPLLTHAESLAVSSVAPSRSAGYTLFRITNPTNNSAVLKPPFPQVLVQSALPVPGQVYNVLSVPFLSVTESTL